jgi:hypothetical protein
MFAADNSDHRRMQPRGSISEVPGVEVGHWTSEERPTGCTVILTRTGAVESARDVTDEASAIESAGLHPRLVASDATNLKVTYPLDLHLAEWILRNREG